MMILNTLFKLVIKKEFVTFLSTGKNRNEMKVHRYLPKFTNEDTLHKVKPRKYIISESNDIGNPTEHNDELLASMIIGDTHDEDIIDTNKVKVYRKEPEYKEGSSLYSGVYEGNYVLTEKLEN